MEDNGFGGDGADSNTTHWWRWWALAGTAQFVWGVSSFRKGYAGDSRLMPLKAFTVGSLFVSSAASVSVAALQASGIHKIEDFLEMGANARTRLGIRGREKKTDDL